MKKMSSLYHLLSSVVNFTKSKIRPKEPDIFLLSHFTQDAETNLLSIKIQVYVLWIFVLSFCLVF